MKRFERLTTFMDGFTPRSALLCSAEGDPPGDGGAPATPAAPVTPPANPGTPAITPEVQALIDQARADERTRTSNSVWKQAREKYEKPSAGQQTSQPPKPEATASNGQDALAIIALRDAFDDAISDLTLTGAQKKFVRELVMKERPGDVGDYVSNFVTLSGWNATKPIPAGAAPAASTTTTATPPTIPVTSRSTPPNPATPTEDTPIKSMSEADRRALLTKLVTQHGHEKGNTLYADRMLREMARDNVKVRPRLV
jgi:hypothetical protein